MSAPIKIVVLGSNSFSGASFTDFALSQGAEVLGISRSQEPHKVFLPYRWSGHDDNFRFFAYDINNHLDQILDLMAAENPDYFINFAAQSMVGQSWDFPEDWFRTNAVSTVMLHNRLRKECDYLKRYVHVTTPEVYGSTNGWIKEDTPYNPSTPYAVSRAAGDMSLKTFVDAYGFPAVSTRAANVYGPGQPLYRIISRTILCIRLGEKLQLHGGGISVRSFIHINDVSDATWKIMTNGVVGETYHISTEETVSIYRLVKLICEMMGVNFDDAVEVAGERLGKDAAYMLDSTKIRDTLFWSDKICLDQGLRECISWVDANLEVLKTQEKKYIHKI